MRLSKRQWRLVEEHSGLLQKCARKVIARLPPSVELDDLVGIGRIALIGAAQRFDRAQGVPFAAYAWHRIHGSMLDEFRRRGNYQFELHDQIYEDHGQEHDQADDDKPTVVAIDPRPGPERLAESAWLQPILQRALECLSPDERWVLVAHAEGMSLEKIGDRYGKSITWTWNLLQVARKKMQRELAMHRLDGL